MFQKKIVLSTICVLFFTGVFSQTSWKVQDNQLVTRWAKDVNPGNALKEYPRPQLVRSNWTNLNGLWDYAITAKEVVNPTKFGGQILVPFPLESALSGVRKLLLPTQNLWYKRNFPKPQLKKSEKVILNFGAVDYQATVFVNGQEVGEHTGGYSAFSFDITPFLKNGGNEITVKVFDPTDAGNGPTGKQVLNPQNIYYTPTSGIWQTVWLEVVPANHIASLTITPDIDKGVVNLTVNSETQSPISITFNGQTIKGRSNTPLAVPVKNIKLWSPGNPYLYAFQARLGQDVVNSYFGMRKISIAKDSTGTDRIFLNNKPYYNLGTLDQGFWPDGLYTAPTDEALAFDIKAIKAMGFNTIRKHIKVEPARWYYWADKLGMLVWQDMVNPNQGLPEGSKAAFEQGCKEELAQLHNYPSITTWVLFNEKWGQYDQKRLTDWIKQTDPSRILNGHSGELLYVNGQLRSPSPDAYVDADLTDVHAYPDPMMSLKQAGKAQVCGEFGGIGVSTPGHQWNPATGWGYVQVKPSELKGKYAAMVKQLVAFKEAGLSGSIYTQPFDVEGEENGMMTYDREVVKVPFAELRAINSVLNPSSYIVPQITGQIAGQTVYDKKYQQNLALYKNGVKDKEFLKQLATSARLSADKDNASKIIADYMAETGNHFTKEDVRFIGSFITAADDPVYRFFIQHAVAIDSLMSDKNLAFNTVSGYITNNKINPLLWRDAEKKQIISANPDWDGIATQLAVTIPKEFVDRTLLDAKIDWYTRKDDKQALIKYNIAKIDTYGLNINGAMETASVNNMCYELIFQYSNDAASLNKAIGYMEKIIVNDPRGDTRIDTYANLLYKAGRKTDAIAQEEKALKLAKEKENPGHMKEYEINLAKMKSSQPTWITK